MRRALYLFLSTILLATTGCLQDRCKSTRCGDNGVCVEGNCVCNTGFEGDTCQFVSRNRFIKTWQAAEGIFRTTDTLRYSCVIVADSAPNAVIIKRGFADSFFTADIRATVRGLTLVIPAQQPDTSFKYRISTGTFTYSGGRLITSWTISSAYGSGRDTSFGVTGGSWQ